MDSRIRVVVFPVDTGKEGKNPSDAAAVRECQRPHFSGYPSGEIPDGNFRGIRPENYSRKLRGGTEQVLFGVGTPRDPAGEKDLLSCRDHVTKPAGSGMVPG